MKQSWFRGVLFTLASMVTSFLGLVILSFPASVVLLPVSVYLYQAAMDSLFSSWSTFVSALLEVVFGIRVRVSGDLQRLKGPCLIVMNHRTRFDWMFFWSFMLRMGDTRKLKIVLKSSLKKVPIFGWGLQKLQFFFLSRLWEKDKHYITDTMEYFNSTGYPVNTLLFPEGTDLSPSNREKSQAYAKEKGIPSVHYVLHPRTKGFVHLLKEMRKAGTPPSVYDVSVAYVGPIPQNESNIASGDWPDEIHFHSRLVPPSEVPLEDNELEQWLKQCWEEKEEQLRVFYSQGRRHFHDNYLKESHYTQLYMVWCLCFWSALLLLFVTALYHWPTACTLYCLSLFLFYPVLVCLGGLDTAVVWLCKHMHWKIGINGIY